MIVANGRREQLIEDIHEGQWVFRKESEGKGIVLREMIELLVLVAKENKELKARINDLELSLAIQNNAHALRGEK